MNNLQAEELNILEEIQDFCRTNDLRHYVIGGTLLGAIRHKGFIPWDDDIDIGLPRKEYDIFVKTFKSSKLQLKHFTITRNFPYPYAKVTVNTITCIDSSNRMYNYATGPFVDVFPLDRLYKSERLNRFVLLFIRVFRTIASIKAVKKDTLNYRKHRILHTLLPISSVLIYKMIESFLKSRLRTEGKIGNVYGSYGNREMVPIEWFQESEFYQFETTSVPVISHYDDYLKQIYGNYIKIPAVTERNSHLIVVEGGEIK